MVSIGERLREERESLGMTQEQLADALSVTKKTQGIYERGQRSPNAEYLSALADIGCDVLYILTGVRQVKESLELSVRENCMLANYRALPEEDQAAVQRMTSALAKSVKDESA